MCHKLVVFYAGLVNKPVFPLKNQEVRLENADRILQYLFIPNKIYAYIRKSESCKELV